MKNTKKLLLGLISIIAAGVIGPLVWFFSQNSVAMNVSDKDTLTFLFALTFVPTLIFYAIYFARCSKAHSLNGIKPPSSVIFIVLSIVAAAAFFIAEVIFFSEAVIFEVATLILNIVGAVLAFIIG